MLPSCRALASRETSEISMGVEVKCGCNEGVGKYRTEEGGGAGPTPGWVDVDLSFCSEFLTNRSRGGGCHGPGPEIRGRSVAFWPPEG